MESQADQIASSIHVGVRADTFQQLLTGLSEIERYAGNDLVLLALNRLGTISLLVKRMKQLSGSLEEGGVSEEVEAAVDKIAQCVAYLSGPTGTLWRYFNSSSPTCCEAHLESR